MMIKKSANTVGTYLQESTTTNKIAPKSDLVERFLQNPPAVFAVNTDRVGSVTDPVTPTAKRPTDQIFEYLAAHPDVSPDVFVSALGLRISDVLQALSELERFGFIRMTQVDGKTLVSQNVSGP